MQDPSAQGVVPTWRRTDGSTVELHEFVYEFAARLDTSELGVSGQQVAETYRRLVHLPDTLFRELPAAFRAAWQCQRQEYQGDRKDIDLEEASRRIVEGLQWTFEFLPQDVRDALGDNPLTFGIAFYALQRASCLIGELEGRGRTLRILRGFVAESGDLKTRERAEEQLTVLRSAGLAAAFETGLGEHMARRSRRHRLLTQQDRHADAEDQSQAAAAELVESFSLDGKRAPFDVRERRMDSIEATGPRSRERMHDRSCSVEERDPPAPDSEGGGTCSAQESVVERQDEANAVRSAAQHLAQSGRPGATTYALEWIAAQGEVPTQRKLAEAHGIAHSGAGKGIRRARSLIKARLQKMT